jgi:hypothetical protein
MVALPMSGRAAADRHFQPWAEQATSGKFKIGPNQDNKHCPGPDSAFGVGDCDHHLVPRFARAAVNNDLAFVMFLPDIGRPHQSPATSITAWAKASGAS